MHQLSAVPSSLPRGEQRESRQLHSRQLCLSLLFSCSKGSEGSAPAVLGSATSPWAMEKSHCQPNLPLTHFTAFSTSLSSRQPETTHRRHKNDRLTRKHNKHIKWSIQRWNQKIKTKPTRGYKRPEFLETQTLRVFLVTSLKHKLRIQVKLVSIVILASKLSKTTVP